MPNHQLPNLLHFIQYHLLLVIDNEVVVQYDRQLSCEEKIRIQSHLTKYLDPEGN